MRAATVQPPIGTLAAIPFLLSMVAFGGSFYVARLTLRLVEQESAVRAISSAASIRTALKDGMRIFQALR